MDLIYRYNPTDPIPLPPTSPAEAMRRLHEGHARYHRAVTHLQGEILGGAAPEPIIVPGNPTSLGFLNAAGAAAAQAPFGLVLGCSDARAPVELIFDQSPNDLFVVRVAGNVLGVECLGSIDYAVAVLGQSIEIVLVLGHTSCGAVSAAVDSYLAPNRYGQIAFTHALRSLVDRIHIAVRAAAGALERTRGAGVAQHPNYREALIEVSVFLNAAITAHDVRRELEGPDGPRERVVYGVFNLISQRVCARPESGSAEPAPFGEVPTSADEFDALGLLFAEAVAGRGLLD